MTAADTERFRLRRFIERMVQMGECEVHDKPIDLIDVAAVLEGNPKATWFKSVGPANAVEIPDGADVIDLSGATVLPGLIDCHTHLGNRADRYDEALKFKTTPVTSAILAVANAVIHIHGVKKI